MFCRWRSLQPYGAGRPEAFCRAIAIALLLAACCALGCEKSPPPVTDPAMAPWLFDPKSQIDLLKNEDFRLRSAGAFNLGNMGAMATEALPALDKIAKDDPHPKVREKASAAAEKIRAATGGSPSK